MAWYDVVPCQQDRSRQVVAPSGRRSYISPEIVAADGEAAPFVIDCWQPASILPEMGSGLPERIGWAVEMLAVRGDDCLLEVGCGRGVAIAQIAPLLTSGHVLAIDRSATAIAAAKTHNRKWEAAGKVTFRRSALCDLGADISCFDKIFSINVNLFWIDPRAELPVVRKLLKKKGALYLFFQPPIRGQREKIVGRVTEGFSGSDLEIERIVMKSDGAPLLCLICRLSGRG
jgi:SAM-dependent methyltransferase